MKTLIKISALLWFSISVTSTTIVSAAKYPPDLACITSSTEHQWDAVQFGDESIKMATNWAEISMADVVALQIIKDPTRAGLNGSFLSIHGKHLGGTATNQNGADANFIILQNKAKADIGFHSCSRKKNIMSADARAAAPHIPYQVSVDGGSFFDFGTWEPWIIREHRGGIALLNKNTGGYLVACATDSWTGNFGAPNADIHNATIFKVYKKVYKSFELPIIEPSTLVPNTPSQLAEMPTPYIPTFKNKLPGLRTIMSERDLFKSVMPTPFRMLKQLESNSLICSHLLNSTEIGSLNPFLCQESEASSNTNAHPECFENLNPIIIRMDHSKILSYLDLVAHTMTTAQEEGKAAASDMQQHFPAIVKKIGANSRVAVIGDLHGNIEALFSILADLDIKQNFFQPNDTNQLKLAPDCYIIFLGDYVDRGPNGVLAVFIASLLWNHNQESVFLLRGNHEMKSLYDKYGLKKEFGHRNISSSDEMSFTNFFKVLPYSLMLAIAKRGDSGVEIGYNLIQFCHGGLGKMFSNPDQPDDQPDPENEAMLKKYFTDSLFTWDGISKNLNADTEIFELFEPALYHNEHSLIHVSLKNHFTRPDGNDCRSLAMAWNDFGSTAYEQNIFARYMASNRRTSISPAEVQCYFDLAQSKLRPQDTFCAIIRAHIHTCYPWALFTGDEGIDEMNPWINPGEHIELTGRSPRGIPKIISIISSKKANIKATTTYDEIKSRLRIPGESAAYAIIESRSGLEPTAHLQLLYPEAR